MMEEKNTQNNGKLTDEALLKISDIDIRDTKKHSEEELKRWEKLDAAARLERYQKDPSSFLEIKKEIIACVIRSPWGPMLFMAGTKQELQVAWAELNRKLATQLDKMDYESAMKSNSKIHQPGGFLAGLRGRKRIG